MSNKIIQNKITHDELIIPIYNNKIANIHDISNNYIHELTNKYIEISNQVLPFMNSRYTHITNYSSYVYAINDTLLNKWYIGVRYGKNRYSLNCYEDLLQYQSSSTDTEFKDVLKENILNNTDRFKLMVLKEFSDEFHALNYEALLHQIFQVGDSNGIYNPLFYNRTAENFPNYKVYTEIYWDIKDKREIYFEEIISYPTISYHNLCDLVVYNKSIITNNRYCLLINVDKLSELQLHRFDNMDLYVILDNDGNWEIQTRTIHEWLEILGPKGYAFMRPETRNYNVSNHFYDKQTFLTYLEKYNKVTLYYYENRRIYGYTQTELEWQQQNYNFNIFMKKESMLCLTVNNIMYFKTKEACQEAYLEYTLINTIDNSTLLTYKHNGRNLTKSSHYVNLIKSFKNICYKGFILQKYNKLSLV